jgi:hypothetical protein
MESNLALAILMITGVALPGALTFVLMRMSRHDADERLMQLEKRLMHLSSAVELLTDTTESGLKSAFAEIERLGDAPMIAKHRIGLQSRVAEAAGEGKSARQIAQAEGISEGEVRLRLRMTGGDDAVQVETAAAAAAATVTSLKEYLKCQVGSTAR